MSVKASANTVTPLFIETCGGRRFAIHHRALSGQGCDHPAIVYVHPFGDEMNKSRRTAALQARALARLGFEVLQIDLKGCGESPGELREVTWVDWQQDVVAAVQWLRDRPAGPHRAIWLWGLRLGALLVCEAAATASAALGSCNFLLWQPVTQGRTQIQQFLRLASVGATAHLDPQAPRASTTELKARLLAGSSLEIGGYCMSSGLARAIDGLSLSPPGSGAGRRVLWMETGVLATGELNPASASALQTWGQADWLVDAQAVHGPGFWQTTEIEEGHAWIEATCNQLTRATTAPAAQLASLQAA